MKKQPLLYLCVCLIIGILVREYSVASQQAVLCIFACASLLFLCSFIRSYYVLKYRAVAVWALFFGLGMLLHSPAYTPAGTLSGRHSIVFKISGKLNSNQKNRRYEVVVLQLDSILQNDTRAVLSVPKEARSLDFKHLYKTKAYLNTVRPPDNNFTFNYQKYLGRRGIHLQAVAKGEIMSSDRRDLSFAEAIMQHRLEILQRIDSANWQPKTREFTKGIVLADRTEMDAATVSDFGKSGLVHILAISGSHMAVIFWMVLFILKPLFPPKLRMVPIIISVASLWVFAAFIGYGSSVVRSCLMITTYHSYVLLQRRPDLLHSLALAALVILCCDTNQLFDAGFQLSFIAVAGIFWLNGPILSLFPKHKGKIQRYLYRLLALSLSAQLATLPLVILYFHQYSPLSLPANLVAMPLSEVVLVFSFLMTIVGGGAFHFKILDSIYDFIVLKFLDMVHFFADCEGLMFRNIPMTGLEAAVMLMSIFLLRFLLMNHTPKTIIRFAACVLLFLAIRVSLNLISLQKKEAVVLNDFKQKILLVKKENTAYFWIPENTDAKSVTQRLVNPYLTDRRITRAVILNLPNGTEQAKIFGKTVRIK